jgi:alkylated DNA repair dioxygenase AlkB
MNDNLPGFECHELGNGCKFWTGQLSPAMIPNSLKFEALWQMHPKEFHEIKIHGRVVKTPRWQQAYGVDYFYTGSVNTALPVPAVLLPYLQWSRQTVCPALNGLLLNWYDGRLGHYIGRHRDSIKHMHPGAPIVTISFGEERTFRLRQWHSKTAEKRMDFQTRDGAVFVMSWKANQEFTHEVVRIKSQTGRRISVTLRAFEDT